MKAIYLSLFLVISAFSLLAQSPERIFYSSFRPEGLDFYIVKEDAEEYAKFIYHKGIYGGPVSYISGCKRIVFVLTHNNFKLPFLPNVI